MSVGTGPEALTLPQLITAGISFLALVVSLLSLYRTSKVQRQQIRLQARQEAGLRPSISLYLDEGYLRRLGPGAPRVYVFRIVISNGSDLGNSIREARLVIQHGQGQGPSSNLAIPHNPGLATQIPGAAATDALHLPLSIAGRTSVRGLVLFEVPSNLLRDARVESYALQIIDTYGHETAVEALLLSERNQ